MPVNFFLPRWMDHANTNAQNSSARSLLSRFSDPRARWTAIFTNEPAETIRRKGVKIRHLSPRLWRYELILAYQSRFDAIFYPGPDWADEWGIKLRKTSGRRIPVIATIEGVIAAPAEVKQISERVGHPVFSQPGIEPAIPRIRRIYEAADHIIAISPFLARVAQFLYGDKVSCLPLGVEKDIFFNTGHPAPPRCRVIGCGTVKSSKNPQMFLRLAARYKDADFVWFGGGPTRESLIAEASNMGLANLDFPGAPPTHLLADEFRKSSLFVIPSHAEGVPKVTQEAAACGLPIVLNGYYEAPTVVHGRNGLVAWSDEELVEHVGRLIYDGETRARMGEQGFEMAKQWSWDLIAPQWEEAIIRLASSVQSV